MKFFLFLLLPLYVSSKCTIGQGSVIPCGSHTAIVVDSTNYQGNAQTASSIFQFVQTYLSYLNLKSLDYYISMGYYGLSDQSVSWSPILFDFAKNNPLILCENYEGLMEYEQQNHLGRCTIQEAILGLYNVTGEFERNYDSIIWISATHDQVDVDTASKYLSAFPKAQFTVINMGPVDFSSWKGARVICQSYPFPDDFAATVYNQVCRTIPAGDSSCRIIPTTSQPTTTPPVSDNVTCPCIPAQVWNDVFVLFDGVTFTSERFAQTTVVVKNALAKHNIGQQSGYRTRVAISVYGDAVTNVASLTKFQTSTDLLNQNIQMLPNNQGQGTNIKDAIDDARDHFSNLAEHRANARKVIIVVGGDYKPGNFAGPLGSAAHFIQSEGGVILSIDYGSQHGQPGSMLSEIASAGYYIDGITTQSDQIEQLIVKFMCEANCRCQNGYASAVNTSLFTPADGCFKVSNDPNTIQSASINCNDDGAILACTKDNDQKLLTLGKVTVPNPVLWVGLSLVDNQWKWADGTNYNGPVTSGNGTCAFLRRISGFNMEFVQSDCSTPNPFSCQSDTCSSSRYCDDSGP